MINNVCIDSRRSASDPQNIRQKQVYAIILCLVLIFGLLFYILQNEESTKYVIGIAIMITFLILYKYKHIWALYFVVLTIGFPIYFRIMDKDAFTITTFMLIALFVMELIQGHIQFKMFGKFLAVVIICFLMANAISLTRLRGEELMVNMRPFLGLVSAVLLFILVANMVSTIGQLKKVLLTVYIILIGQLLVSLLLLAGTDLSFLSIFATREFEFWTTTHRGSGLVHDYELLAEWYAMFVPFAIWLLTVSKIKIMHFIGILLLVIGIVVTQTRGAFISLGVGLVIMLLFLPGKTVAKRIQYSLAMIILIVGSWFVVGYVARDYRDNLMGRFTDTVESYREGAELTEVLNRQEIWEGFTSRYLSYSLFGSGKRQPPIGNLHSLYFTLLYQIGVVGLGLFVVIIVLLFFTLWRDYLGVHDSLQIRFLSLVTISALTVFAIDEMKIEYVRDVYFMQFAWLFFGFVMVAHAMRNNRKKSAVGEQCMGSNSKLNSR